VLIAARPTCRLRQGYGVPRRSASREAGTFGPAGKV